MIDVLWQRELKTHPIDTPERRAAFEERLEKLLAKIANARVKDHYRREVKNRLFTLWREQGADRRKLPAGAVGTRSPARAGATPIPSARGFITVMTIALANHPWLLDSFADEVASLEIRDKKLAALLQAVTSIIYADTHVTREGLAERLEASPQAKLYAELCRDSAFKRVAFLQPETPEHEVDAQFADLDLSLPRAAEPQPRIAGRRRSPGRYVGSRIRAIRRAAAASGQRRQPACRRRCGRP